LHRPFHRIQQDADCAACPTVSTRTLAEQSVYQFPTEQPVHPIQQFDRAIKTLFSIMPLRIAPFIFICSFLIITIDGI
jgi:hypothetical protein